MKCRDVQSDVSQRAENLLGGKNPRLAVINPVLFMFLQLCLTPETKQGQLKARKCEWRADSCA